MKVSKGMDHLLFPAAPEPSLGALIGYQRDHISLAVKYFVSNPPTKRFIVSSVVGVSAFRSGLSLNLSFAIGVTFLCAIGLSVLFRDPSRKGDAHGFGKEIEEMFDRPSEASALHHNSQKDLTAEELQLLRYFRGITVGLGTNEEDIFAVWSMVGGGKPGVGGQEQLSFTAVRYHASFLCYSVATLASRIPLFASSAGSILDWVLSNLLLKPKVFEFYLHYWPELRGKGPWQCRENIMWTGHVLHVVALYETLTSDDKFSRPGGLAVTESDGKTYRTDAKELALHVAACMRINATGGVPCEPGLVFFQCQNHPFCAFTLLEGLDHFPRGFFDPEKRRFQAFAAKGFRAVVETGGIKIACVTTRQNGPSFDDAYGAELRVLEARLEGADDAQPGESSSRVLASLPFAHIGSDAWDLNYFFMWATRSEPVKAIYDKYVKVRLETLRESGTWSEEECSCCGGDGDGEPKAKHATGWNSAPPAVCCFGLNIPKSAWSSAILPVLAQAEDWDMYETVSKWLTGQLRKEGTEEGVWLGESCEWAIGNTANYAMGVAFRNGADARALHHGLSVREGGVRVLSCEPRDMDVWRCRMEGGALQVGFGAGAGVCKGEVVAKFVVEAQTRMRQCQVTEGYRAKWTKRAGQDLVEVVVTCEITSGGEEKKDVAGELEFSGGCMLTLEF
mmetsp:Transcript_7941/g.16582  ORF Transcript_7941/g.16582 Transcript_7941/m.16582 type:complete len:676 (+) Transcript_7941:167-2194(+)